MTLDEQIRKLQAAYATAEQDAIADYGEEAVDGGGYAELARAVVMMAGPEITAGAKAEFLRMQGLTGYPWAGEDR